MANEKRLIDANALMEFLKQGHDRIMQDREVSNKLKWYEAICFNGVRNAIEKASTVDAVEVVHGRWERCGGDLHSSGYAIFCSVCNKVHFVHRKYSLGGLNCKELFEKPKYCPNCGAKMDGDGNDTATDET